MMASASVQEVMDLALVSHLSTLNHGFLSCISLTASALHTNTEN